MIQDIPSSPLSKNLLPKDSLNHLGNSPLFPKPITVKPSAAEDATDSATIQLACQTKAHQGIQQTAKPLFHQPFDEQVQD